MQVPSESGEQRSEHTIIARTRPSILANVDLILTDIRMPGQVDGLGLISFVQRY